MSGESVRYSANVLELFRSLPGAGPLPSGPGAIVHGEAQALERGAWVRFEARIGGGRVSACAFRAWGCPHVLAASAWACAEMRGAAVDGAPAWGIRRLLEALDAPAEKMGRLLVVEDAMRTLLAKARAVQSP